MSPCWSFIKHVCLRTRSAAHSDTVWYVESYKQLALNSIYKINSPRAAAAHISLLPSSPPPFFLCFSFVYHPALSQTRPSNQLSALSSLFSTSLALSRTPPPPLPCLPIHFQDITDLTGHFVVIDAVARGPAGGRRHLGTGSALRDQRLGSGVMGWSWHHPKGMCMCESPPIRPDILWPVFGPTSSLSLCHPSPSCSNKAPVCVDLRFSFS